MISVDAKKNKKLTRFNPFMTKKKNENRDSILLSCQYSPK